MPIIKVENLSKKYILSHQAQVPYTALRDVITEKIKAAGSRILRPFTSGRTPSLDSSREDFWALKDVSFEINQGDRVGIIGRNGAGKSTLLKILSRITEPTAGRITIRGRVASLLEVGTGFHPELTGRENIFLNGAILGMTKAEIKKKFDEIVAFAEVDKFLDTPVKRYSSGMYVRLAFAVAAHLEPEILIVDEVLAVGDAQFQKKCLGKMEEVGKEGRTVLFVSHNMHAVKALCDSAILLDEGKIKLFGHTSEVVNNYFLSLPDTRNLKLEQRTDRAGSGKAKFKDISVLDSRGRSLHALVSGDEYTIRLKYSAIQDLEKVVFKMSIYNFSDQMMFHFDSSVYYENICLKIGEGSVDCIIDSLPLSEGNYRINIGILVSEEVVDHLTNAFSFSVDNGDFFRNGKIVKNIKEICLVHHQWKI